MYKVFSWKNEIEEVECIRETAAFVVFKSRHTGGTLRESKSGSCGTYFGTWGEAHTYLVSRIAADISRAKDTVTRYTGDLSKIMEMKEPVTK